MPLPSSWDIFCTVIDNYGDIGVCWRLARQLAAEQQVPVRLWVDDLASFARLHPAIDPAAPRQFALGVEVRHWTADATAGAGPHDAVVAAFGCALPEPFLQAMAARRPSPAWINLEYLTAESWAEDCHTMPSRHPRLPLTQHFFFPGFSARTGGLLCESGLRARRDAFQADPAAREVWLAELGVAAAPAGALTVSLFAYENPAVAGLLDAMAGGGQPVRLLVPEGRVLAEVARWCGRDLGAGTCHVHGQLALTVLPFVEQSEYDKLLWACDVNFVRGEDSFARAQWAARPLVWQIYPQEEGAHLPKLDAFLAHYTAGLAAADADLIRRFNRAWNGAGGEVAALWPALAARRESWARQALAWEQRLAGLGDLAGNLARFCGNLL